MGGTGSVHEARKARFGAWTLELVRELRVSWIKLYDSKFMLSREEFARVLRSAPKIMATLDVESFLRESWAVYPPEANTIDAAGTIAALSIMCDGPMDDKIKVIFRVFDFNNDKHLARDELAILFMSTNACLCRYSGQKVNPAASASRCEVLANAAFAQAENGLLNEAGFAHFVNKFLKVFADKEQAGKGKAGTAAAKDSKSAKGSKGSTATATATASPAPATASGRKTKKGKARGKKGKAPSRAKAAPAASGPATEEAKRGKAGRRASADAPAYGARAGPTGTRKVMARAADKSTLSATSPAKASGSASPSKASGSASAARAPLSTSPAKKKRAGKLKASASGSSAQLSPTAAGARSPGARSPAARSPAARSPAARSASSSASKSVSPKKQKPVRRAVRKAAHKAVIVRTISQQDMVDAATRVQSLARRRTAVKQVERMKATKEREEAEANRKAREEEVRAAAEAQQAVDAARSAKAKADAAAARARHAAEKERAAAEAKAEREQAKRARERERLATAQRKREEAAVAKQAAHAAKAKADAAAQREAAERAAAEAAEAHAKAVTAQQAAGAAVAKRELAPSSKQDEEAQVDAAVKLQAVARGRRDRKAVLEKRDAAASAFQFNLVRRERRRVLVKVAVAGFERSKAPETDEEKEALISEFWAHKKEQVGRRAPAEFAAIAKVPRPTGPILVLAGMVCILFDEKPTWPNAQKLLQHPDFVDRLLATKPEELRSHKRGIAKRLLSDNGVLEGLAKVRPTNVQGAVTDLVQWVSAMFGMVPRELLEPDAEKEVTVEIGADGRERQIDEDGPPGGEESGAAAAATAPSADGVVGGGAAQRSVAESKTASESPERTPAPAKKRSSPAAPKTTATAPAEGKEAKEDAPKVAVPESPPQRSRAPASSFSPGRAARGALTVEAEHRDVVLLSHNRLLAMVRALPPTGGGCVNVRGSSPLMPPPNGAGVGFGAYYEVRINDIGVLRDVAVGLVPASYLPNQRVGYREGAIGYMGDTGKTFSGVGALGTVEREFGASWHAGDVVGCGINYDTSEVFFTHNGAYLGVAAKLRAMEPLWPCVSLCESGIAVEANFGASPFVWELGDMGSTSPESSAPNAGIDVPQPTPVEEDGARPRAGARKAGAARAKRGVPRGGDAGSVVPKALAPSHGGGGARPIKVKPPKKTTKKRGSASSSLASPLGAGGQGFSQGLQAGPLSGGGNVYIASSGRGKPSPAKNRVVT